MYAKWSFARIHGAGWGWAAVIWLYSLITYIPLDILKFTIRYALSGRAWNNLLQNKVLPWCFPFPFSLVLYIIPLWSYTFEALVHFGAYTFKTFIFVSILSTLIYFGPYEKTSKQEDRESREI